MGLNFTPVAYWYCCRICKVCIQDENKFIIHKMTKHPDPDPESFQEDNVPLIDLVSEDEDESNEEEEASEPVTNKRPRLEEVLEEATPENSSLTTEKCDDGSSEGTTEDNEGSVTTTNEGISGTTSDSSPQPQPQPDFIQNQESCSSCSSTGDELFFLEGQDEQEVSSSSSHPQPNNEVTSSTGGQAIEEGVVETTSNIISSFSVEPQPQGKKKIQIKWKIGKSLRSTPDTYLF